MGLELCSLSPVHAGRQHTAILMRLLLASIRPMVDSLQLWAEEGLVVDHLSEALICQGGAPRAAHMLPSSFMVPSVICFLMSNDRLQVTTGR